MEGPAGLARGLGTADGGERAQQRVAGEAEDLLGDRQVVLLHLLGRRVQVRPGRLGGAGVEGEAQPVGVLLPLGVEAVGELGEVEARALQIDAGVHLRAVLPVHPLPESQIGMLEEGARVVVRQVAQEEDVPLQRDAVARHRIAIPAERQFEGACFQAVLGTHEQALMGAGENGPTDERLSLAFRRVAVHHYGGVLGRGALDLYLQPLGDEQAVEAVQDRPGGWPVNLQHQWLPPGGGSGDDMGRSSLAPAVVPGADADWPVPNLSTMNGFMTFSVRNETNPTSPRRIPPLRTENVTGESYAKPLSVGT